MYFEHSKRSYYRFPNKNSVSDFDTQLPYYFPERSSLISDDFTGNFLDSNYNSYDDGKNYSSGYSDSY
jgi:hypothetical protein